MKARSPRARPITAALLRRMPLPRIDAEADKDSRGRVLIVGGSAGVPGAVLLSGIAALRAGAGKLQMATVREAAIALGLAVPEALVIPLGKRPGIRPLAAHLESLDAVLIGPGMEEQLAVKGFVRDVARRMKEASTLVLDAAALAGAKVVTPGVITPHSGEMASLLGIDRDEVEKNAAECAQAAADRFGCVVALKGAETFIARGAELYRYDGGGVGLATSGSGDTLSGIVAGLAASGADPLVAALWGVWTHGAAGKRLAKRVGRVGFLAREVLDEIPAVIGNR